jgi:hypothetical protein
MIVFKWAKRSKEYMNEVLYLAKRFNGPYVKMIGNEITFLGEQYFGLVFVIMENELQEFLETLTENQMANLSAIVEKESHEHFYLKQNYQGCFYFNLRNLEIYKEKLAPKITVL